MTGLPEHISQLRVAVIGLGYVGLPLAVALGKNRQVVGFDVSKARIGTLREGRDTTGQLTSDQLRAAELLDFTTDPTALGRCNTFIVTVPTPIDEHKNPDLRPLLSATRLVANYLKPGDLVIYESTVYPGATEEECVPVLEQLSQLKFNRDFWVGYSPERINPGDHEHTLERVTKVVAASSEAALSLVDNLYSSVISAGTHPVSSIKVAEAAKIIENTQRDLNIALMNELAMIFKHLDIDTEEVLRAAETKWNFHAFRPGLVGGHCLGVDPYYLTHKAQAVGYHPQVILAGRRINDSMPRWLAGDMIKEMLRRGMNVRGGRALILGLTFKENCSDIRNSKVVDIVKELSDCGMTVDVHDPHATASAALDLYGILLSQTPEKGMYDLIVVAVAHREFLSMTETELRAWGQSQHLLCDLRYVLPKDQSDFRL